MYQSIGLLTPELGEVWRMRSSLKEKKLFVYVSHLSEAQQASITGVIMVELHSWPRNG